MHIAIKVNQLTSVTIKHPIAKQCGQDMNYMMAGVVFFFLLFFLGEIAICMQHLSHNNCTGYATSIYTPYNIYSKHKNDILISLVEFLCHEINEVQINWI